MAVGLTNKVRALVMRDYVSPARKAGHTYLTVRVRDIRTILSVDQPMRGESHTICQALQSRKFLDEAKMTVESMEGPPSYKSPTVVMHYRLQPTTGKTITDSQESAEQWASRVTAGIRGLLKDEYAAYGGGEAYLKWVRSESPTDEK